MKRIALILLVASFIGGCATAPVGGDGETTVDTALTPPALPEEARVDLVAGVVDLRLEEVDTEFRERLSSGALTLEGIYTPPRGESVSVKAEYSNGRATLPMTGLSPGEEYTLALRLRSAADVGPWSEAVSISLPPWEGALSLLFADPFASYPLSKEPLDFVDPIPRFTLESEGAPAPTEATWRIIRAGADGVDTGSSIDTRSSTEPESSIDSGSVSIRDGSAQIELAAPLPEGRLTLEVGLAFANGIRLSTAESFELRLGEAAPPRATAHGFGRSVMERPALRWAHQPGVDGYEVAFREANGPAPTEELAEAPTESVSTTFLNLGPAVLDPGSAYVWRVRPIVDGEEGPWSEAYGFSYDPAPIPFASIVEIGERVSYTQGFEAGTADESPLREVELTVPFQMAITEITNSVAAALINSGLAHGRFQLDGAVVVEEGVPLLHLDTLEYGEQLGLSFEPGAERIAAVAGRANHPAVGFTWHGANALAAELTLLDGGTAAGEVWSYRLPTEAEWEYAATGGTGRVYPWGEDSPRGRANYYRSGDAYEDVNPPYTRNGGPTTPGGFFGSPSPFGARDLLGNVWEWCMDWYDPEAYAGGEAVDPRGPESPVEDEFGVAHRSLRGLAWNSRVDDLRVQNRGKFPPNSSSWSIGVRLLRSPADLP